MDSKLEKIQVRSKINEVYAESEIIQNFINKGTSAVEMVVKIPFAKSTVLKSFKAKMGDNVISSKISEKEKALETYTDSLASGNVGLLGNLTKDDEYEINIGNLSPGEEVELTSEFIQLISQQDKSYQFTFSLYKFPYFNNFPNIVSVKPQFSAELTVQSKITRLISPTHKLNRTFSNDSKTCELTISSQEIFTNSNEINILFRTAEMNRIKLYEQYDSILQNYAYTAQYLLDKKNQDITDQGKIDTNDLLNYEEQYESSQANDTQGVFVFLVDQSGSMSGSSIKIAEQSIRLFLQSLPENSYFDIIGFGSSYQTFTSTPFFYESSNISKVLSSITNLDANLGGTNISSPLKFIFARNYDDKLSKNLFLLTDGEVENKEECIDLISENSHKFRVHAIGIGNSVDKKLIEDCGKVGKGSFQFAPEVMNLKKVVIKALNSALKPYLNNIKVEVTDDQQFLEKRIIEYPPQNDKNMLTYHDELFTYSFITTEKLGNDAVLKYSAFDPVSNKTTVDVFSVNDILYSIKEGNCLGKAIVGTALKNNTTLSQEEEVKLSLKFQVISKNTSLFAEFTTERNGQSELIKQDMCSLNKHQPQPQISLFGSQNLLTGASSFNTYGLFGQSIQNVVGSMGGFGSATPTVPGSAPFMSAMPVPYMMAPPSFQAQAIGNIQGNTPTTGSSAGSSIPLKSPMYQPLSSPPHLSFLTTKSFHGSCAPQFASSAKPPGVPGYPQNNTFSATSKTIPSVPGSAPKIKYNAFTAKPPTIPGVPGCPQNTAFSATSKTIPSVPGSAPKIKYNAFTAKPPTIPGVPGCPQNTAFSATSLNPFGDIVTNIDKKPTITLISNKFDEIFYNELISSQNMLNGSWGESLHTKALKKKYTDDYLKLENYVKQMLNCSDELIMTIAYTILVIKFLNEEFKEKKDEFLLIASKGKKFIKKNGIDFDSAMSVLK